MPHSGVSNLSQHLKVLLLPSGAFDPFSFQEVPRVLAVITTVLNGHKEGQLRSLGKVTEGPRSPLISLSVAQDGTTSETPESFLSMSSSSLPPSSYHLCLPTLVFICHAFLVTTTPRSISIELNLDSKKIYIVYSSCVLSCFILIHKTNGSCQTTL